MAQQRRRSRGEGGGAAQAPAEKAARLKTRTLALVDCHPHPRNESIRKHPEQGSDKWEALAKSLAHDYFDPIIWNERNGMLVAGHFRRKVLLSEGYTHADAVVVDYDEETHLARLLAANRLMGADDVAGVKALLGEICGWPEIDLDWTGFTNKEIEDMGAFPEAEFDAEEDGMETAPIEEQETTSATPDQAVRYFQLVYSADDYAEFHGLLEAYRQRHKQALEEAFETKPGDMANVLLHALRTAV